MTPQLTSPKVMVSARNDTKKEQPLLNTEDPRNVRQSHEAPFNAVPRPRFKINDDAGNQVESVMSHFSQSEINNETEGPDPTAMAANSTVTVLNQGAAVRIPQSSRNGQHSSHLD